MTRIAFTGDLGFSSKYFRGTYNKPDVLHPELVPYLSDSDYTVVNVEGCLYKGEGTAEKPIVHANPPECVDFLRKLNGNIWNLANNHIMDCGRAGLESTLRIAKEQNVRTLGVGLNMAQAAKPVIIPNDGADIGIVSVTQEETPEATDTTEGVVQWDNLEKLGQMIRDVKKTCRWCIVVVHAGPEFCQLMPPSVRDIYRSYLTLGADVVVGHHPHVLQNYEVVGEKIIFYSLGNFVFDTDYQRLQRYTDQGVFIKLNFGKDSFTWDHRAMKIDRETQTINPCKTPGIFKNVSDKQYAILWSLAMHDLYENERVKLGYLKPEMKGCSDEEWLAFYQKRIQKNPYWQCILDGERIYKYRLWEPGCKRVIKYITDGMR